MIFGSFCPNHLPRGAIKKASEDVVLCGRGGKRLTNLQTLRTERQSEFSKTEIKSKTHALNQK